MKIQIDTREKQRTTTAKQYYTKNHPNNEILTEQLPYGDYIFDNKVAFEFKTANDFISSSINHSILPQLLNQNDKFKYSFLIISGDIEQAIKLKAKYTPRRRNKTYYSKVKEYTTIVEHVIRLLRLICPIIYTKTDNMAFETMIKQAKTCLRDNKFLQTVRLTNTVKNPAVRYLTGSKDIGVETANLICDYYGITNLRQLLDLDKDKLLQIKGIGEKKANLILKTIK